MVDCPFIHGCFGVGARQEAWKRVVGVLLCSGRAAFVLYVREVTQPAFYGR